MHFNEVLLVPGCGYFGENTPFDPGQSYLNLQEIDVIKVLRRSLEESLSHVKIRVRSLPTFKSPGLSMIERFDFIEPYDFVIHIKAGMLKGRAPHPKNETLLFHGKDIDPFVLKGFEENCREYGKLSSFYHKQQKSTEDVEDKMLSKSLPKGIRLDIFQLNGPDIDNYYTLIPHLAKSLALTLEESRRLHRSGAQKAR